VFTVLLTDYAMTIKSRYLQVKITLIPVFSETAYTCAQRFQ